jgi:D-beta-D-heptose 7-phosphate kinase / D-beta-D-heptose 1-phosphate adenosyltransferase
VNNNLMRLIGDFSNVHLLVIGEGILDSYLVGSAGRISREAPVPVVDVAARRDAPGGAANAAVNAHSLGARVTLLSVLGEDAEAYRLCRALESYGLSASDLLADESRQTVAKHRVVANEQVLVRFDHGSREPLQPRIEEALIGRLQSLFLRADAVLVSDYGCGIMTPRIINALAELQARAPRVIVADSDSPAAYRHARLTAAKPNYPQAARLLGQRELEGADARVQQILAGEQRLLELTSARICAATLDTEGALVFERGQPAYRTYARPTSHARAAGAGDTFASAFTLALAAGAATPAAAEVASAAAAIAVGKEGTVACSTRELREYLSAGDKYVPDLARLAARVEFYRHQGRRVVFANGCFDILHRGHIAHLNQAKALGDVLVVGVNTDAGVRRLKGPPRPINTLEDRVQVLAALSGVDHVVPFDGDTAEQVIRAIRPDVFAKGGNYTRDGLPEAALVEELGGTVNILPYIEDRSTTALIERIREVSANAA